MIEAENLGYKYPQQKTLTLRDINVRIRDAECCLLMGPSGCGKSTFCLTLNGVIPHLLGGKLNGDLSVNGKDVRDTETKLLAKEVMLVFQDPDQQLCNILVEDEVAFGLQNLLFEREEITERVNTALKFVGLTKYREKKVWELSGGEKQRLAIASALAMRPKILVLDEPTSNLDPVGTKKVLELIEEIRRNFKITVILIEHKVDELIHKVDRVVLMSEGTIVYDGSPREAIEEHGEQILDLGLWVPQVSELGLRLRNTGLAIPRIPLTLGEGAQIFGTMADHVKFQAAKRYERASERGNDREPVIIAEDLHFTYPDGIKALQGVNMKIRRGDMVAIVGQNGSGKSTLALHFVGINKPTSGRVLVGGIDTRQLQVAELARRVAYVFQYPEHQFVENTIYNEVAYGLRVLRLPEEQIRREATEMLSTLGMLEYADSHPYEISMGQKRRLSVASMLIMNPDVVILDEPTYGQDQRSARTLMEYMRKLKNKGKSVIFITHDMKLVAEYAETVFVLKEGKVAFVGSPRQLFTSQGSLEESDLTPPPISLLSQRIEPGSCALTIDELMTCIKVKRS